MNKIKIIIILVLSLFLLAEECNENKSINSVKIAPNPADSQFELIIELLKDTGLNITIHNTTGNMILEPVKGINYQTGEIRIPVQCNSFTPGAYIVTVTNGMENVSEKLLIVH